jgi:hypothetical protein
MASETTNEGSSGSCHRFSHFHAMKTSQRRITANPPASFDVAAIVITGVYSFLSRAAISNGDSCSSSRNTAFVHPNPVKFWL